MSQTIVTRITTLGLAVLVCVVVAVSAAKVVSRLYFEMGRAGSMMLVPPLTFAASIFCVSGACFLIFWVSLRRLEIRMSTSGLTCTFIVAFAIGLTSQFIGKAPYQSFLDGFTVRARSILTATNVTAWARTVFEDSRLARSADEVVELPQGKIPPLFFPLFVGQKPSAVVSYSPVRAPVAVHVFVGGGFGKWGVAVFNTNSAPASDAFTYRPCGSTLYTFHSSR